MWVWQQTAPGPVVSWALANGVTTVFAYYDPAADTAWLRALKTLCDGADITLDALGGEPDWTSRRGAALAWARGATDSGLFHGLHLDVEPYLAPGWPQTSQAYVDLLDQLPRALPLEVDVPFWYSGILADAILQRVDGVTIMSYRNTATGPNSVLDVAADLLQRAGRAAKPARLAAETQTLNDCQYCSFHGTSDAQLRRTLREVDTAAQQYPAFAGIAIHQYKSWIVLSS